MIHKFSVICCWLFLGVDHIFDLFLWSFRYVWESKADGSFAISDDTWNEPLGRGTEIRLHLRDEAKEYLEQDKLKVGAYFNLVSISSACTLLHFPLCYVLVIQLN